MELIKHIDFTKSTSLDQNLWNIRTGDKWANNELQHYVDNSNNLFFDDGLVIRATYDGENYYSSRLDTKNKFSFKYGKIEIIAKVPEGKGTWPALWLMPEKDIFGNWPKSGEIDIMEHVGRDLNNVFLCIHSESYNHVKNTHLHKEVIISNASTEFHKYAILWNENEITYYIDNKEVVSYKKEKLQDQTKSGWPFDNEFYLIMNLAIGGKFGGKVDNDIFPKDFTIKDIKVWQ